jgi:hypothetical protein
MANRGNFPLQPDNLKDFGRQSGPSTAPMPNARPWRRGQAPRPRSGAPKAQGWTAAPAVAAQLFGSSVAAEHVVSSTSDIVPKAPSTTPGFHTTLTGTTRRVSFSTLLVARPNTIVNRPEGEASGVVLLPEQMAKMCASHLQRAYLEELTRCDDWDRILRIAEHAKVKPNAGRHPGRVGAEL